MDLVTLFQKVPSLLDACVNDEIPALRGLRMINKEFSKVALQGLRSFTLTLKGLDGYQRVIGARLLQQTGLETLRVHLLLSEAFNPAATLAEFLRKAGASFKTITNLALHLQNTSGQIIAAGVLNDLLISLVNACPSLRTFTTEGQPSQTLLRQLGQTCPLLSALTVIAPAASDLTYLQNVILLQPPLLPHLSSLTFQDCKPDFQLPDMSGHLGIKSLHAESCIIDTSHFSRLPRSLQSLRCHSINKVAVEPALVEGLLPNLLSVEIFKNQVMLSPFAGLLRAAPSLRDIILAPATVVYCFITESIIASQCSHLSLLQHRSQLHSGFKDVQFTIYCDTGDPQGRAFLNRFLAILPCMTFVRNCGFVKLQSGKLQLVFKVFPNITYLQIGGMDALTDVELKDMAVCQNLTRLCLIHCNNVSPAGLLSLCQCCPRLSIIWCRYCGQLTVPALLVCNKQLRQQGLLTRLVEQSRQNI